MSGHILIKFLDLKEKENLGHLEIKITQNFKENKIRLLTGSNSYAS